MISKNKVNHNQIMFILIFFMILVAIIGYIHDRVYVFWLYIAFMAFLYSNKFLISKFFTKVVLVVIALLSAISLLFFVFFINLNNRMSDIITISLMLFISILLRNVINNLIKKRTDKGYNWFSLTFNFFSLTILIIITYGVLYVQAHNLKIGELEYENEEPINYGGYLTNKKTLAINKIVSFEPFYFSTMAFFAGGAGNINPQGWSKFITVTEVILGQFLIIVIFALGVSKFFSNRSTR